MQRNDRIDPRTGLPLHTGEQVVDQPHPTRGRAASIRRPSMALNAMPANVANPTSTASIMRRASVSSSMPPSLRRASLSQSSGLRGAPTPSTLLNVFQNSITRITIDRLSRQGTQNSMKLGQGEIPEPPPLPSIPLPPSPGNILTLIEHK